MKVKYHLIALLLLFFSISCSTENGTEVASTLAAAEQNAVSPKPEIVDTGVQKQLIKGGSVEFETDDLAKTRRDIYAALVKYKGYVASDREFKRSGEIRNEIVLRVPAANFDALLTAVTQGVDKLDRKTINVKDVTEEFLDIQARLKAKKDLETRYSQLLAQANKVSELLEIEKELAKLRGEIESIEGRLKYLANKVAYSTLTVTFYEKVPFDTAFGHEFKNGFNNGWNNLIWFFVFLTNVWPFVLILILLIIIFSAWKRRNKKI